MMQQLQMQQAAQQGAAQQQQAEMLRIMAVVDNLVGQQPRVSKGRTKPGRRERQRARELRAAAAGEGATAGMETEAEMGESEDELETGVDVVAEQVGRVPVEVKQAVISLKEG